VNKIISESTAGKQHSVAALLFFLATNFAIGTIGGIVTASSVGSWYRTLNKPAFNPPDFIFAPVWSTLYALIAFAAWRVWRTTHPQRRFALQLYGTQLLFNFIWSIAFFGLRNPVLALIDSIALTATAVLCLRYFARIDRLAALVWIPYMAWLGFALVLTAAIVQFN
jgi:tryptophan-rich sensory protein